MGRGLGHGSTRPRSHLGRLLRGPGARAPSQGEGVSRHWARVQGSGALTSRQGKRGSRRRADLARRTRWNPRSPFSEHQNAGRGKPMRKRARAPNAPLGRAEAARLCGPRGPAHVARPAARKRRGCGRAAAGLLIGRCLPRCRRCSL